MWGAQSPCFSLICATWVKAERVATLGPKRRERFLIGILDEGQSNVTWQETLGCFGKMAQTIPRMIMLRKDGIEVSEQRMVALRRGNILSLTFSEFLRQFSDMDALREKVIQRNEEELAGILGEVLIFTTKGPPFSTSMPPRGTPLTGLS